MGINLTEISQKVLDTVINASNVFRKMYDLHYNPNPIDVPMEYIDENGQKRTTQVPNRSKVLGEFEEWKRDFEENRIFEIEGDTNIFYPVAIQTYYEPYHFYISRDNIHWNGDWYGNIMAEFLGIAAQYGNGPEYRGARTNINKIRRFIARAYEIHENGIIILYLRGSTKYRFRGRYCNLVDFSANEKHYEIPSSEGIRKVTFRPIADNNQAYVAPFTADFVEQFSTYEKIVSTVDGIVIE